MRGMEPRSFIWMLASKRHEFLLMSPRAPRLLSPAEQRRLVLCSWPTGASLGARAWDAYSSKDAWGTYSYRAALPNPWDMSLSRFCAASSLSKADSPWLFATRVVLIATPRAPELVALALRRSARRVRAVEGARSEPRHGAHGALFGPPDLYDRSLNPAAGWGNAALTTDNIAISKEIHQLNQQSFTHRKPYGPRPHRHLHRAQAATPAAAVEHGAMASADSHRRRGPGECDDRTHIYAGRHERAKAGHWVSRR